MAWNEPGGGNKDPWGDKGNRGGKDQGPPDLDEAFRKLQDKMGGVFGGGKGGGTQSSTPKGLGGIVGLVAGFALVGYLYNSLYTVDTREQVVILSLGKYSETLDAGLHMYFPPLQSKFQENVTQVRTYNLEQQMLTEDENIVQVSLSVQYNIASLKDYVLNVADPTVSLREATQSALRHEVGSSEMSRILTEGREELRVGVKNRLQTYLDSYGTGLNVIKVNIERTQPPQEVQSAFDDVIRAREDEQRSKNKAEAYANGIVPEARGQAQRLREESEGYRQEIIAKAQGEASRFTQLLAEYQKAPDVTRERLYLETMQSVLSSANKVIVDVDKGGNMMYLPLDKMMGANNGSTSRSASKGGSSAQLQLSRDEISTLADQIAEELRKRVDSSSRSGRSTR